jgi:hypothetical protein
MNILTIDDLNNFIEENELDDLSISTGGGDFKREILPAKNHVVRLVSYVEMGTQEKKKYQSEEIDLVDTVRLVFEVLSKDGIRLDEHGKPANARRLFLTCKKSTHERSTMRKLFELMREGDSSITNFAQMIGSKAWKLKVNWEQNKKVLQTKKERDAAKAASEKEPDNKELRIWETWKDSGVPMLSPAVNAVLDEDGEETDEVKPIDVPAMLGKIEFFLWDKPQQAHWDSLFAEGEYERKAKDGTVTKVSKNFVQNDIIAAKNYDGSPLQCMLDGVDFDADMYGGDVVDSTDSGEEEKPAKEKKEKKPKKDKKSKKAKKEDPAQNEIDELGL